MNLENSNDDVPIEFDFRGDAAPTSMDPYCDDVISDRQQSILNELRIHFCREDLIYLNNHKEVEAIVSLLLNGILKKSPKNPYTYAASYLRNPQTAKLIANFKRFKDFQYEDILKKDYEQYATTAAAVTINDIEKVESMVTLNKQTEVSEDDEANVIVNKYDLCDGETDVVTDEEAEMTVSHKE
ncbi:Uncharacterized protein FWK35_00003467 [Aphis craccivora]|uniref:Uncharacterized protein n=1 Tax=Aphis craccivora TaxID=307492 RepID=A0A6G0ZPZ9_APHCR|nr:Uncharacterized protein FWK35_00003467 [Aphis craccivora]